MARFVFAIIVIACSTACDRSSVALTIPPHLYAVVGVPMVVLRDNVILADRPDSFRMTALSTVSSKETPASWTITAKPRDIGDHLVNVVIRDERGRVVDSVSSTLHVAPARAGVGQTVRLLMVGDSLTRAGIYPTALARMMAGPENAQMTMLGRLTPAPGVAAEGIGGWRWATYLNHPASPFLDVDAYVRDVCGGVAPDIVTFLLGVNDVINGAGDLGGLDDPASVETAIDTMITSAEALLARFRTAMPAATFGIALVPPPNLRAETFELVYPKFNIRRENWRRAQHRLVRRQIDHFGEREGERIFLVPTEIGIDQEDGYAPNDAVHPNVLGYEQIANVFFAWLKVRTADLNGMK